MDTTTTEEIIHRAASQPNDNYDGPLVLFADLMNVLGEHQGVVVGAAEQETGVRLMVTELAFDLPMELRVRENETGALTLRAGPPTQRIETTIFPVLHRLQVRLVRTDQVFAPTAVNTD